MQPRQARDELLRAVTPVFQRFDHCALVGYPNHANPGDAAIWLATLELLATLGVEVRYRCGLQDYDAHAVQRAVGFGGCVVLKGGGWLGDVWDSGEFITTSLAGLERHPVVMLPQSSHFTGPASAARFRLALGEHPDLTLFVRDGSSLGQCREVLGIDPILAPDTAVMLGGRLPALRPPTRDINWILRTDRESTGNSHADAVDWVRPRSQERRDDRELRLLRRAGTKLRSVGQYALVARVNAAVEDRQASKRLRYGTDILSAGRVIVTDRLHVHILAWLLGKPHVLLDNSYGKLSAFYESWTQDQEAISFAANAADAAKAAQDLLASE